jgi:hypothetical protein
MGRLEDKTGVVIDLHTVLASIPLPIPASIAGFALAIAGTLLGLLLVWAGRWAQRY